MRFLFIFLCFLTIYLFFLLKAKAVSNLCHCLLLDSFFHHLDNNKTKKYQNNYGGFFNCHDSFKNCPGVFCILITEYVSSRNEKRDSVVQFLVVLLLHCLKMEIDSYHIQFILQTKIYFKTQTLSQFSVP